LSKKLILGEKSNQSRLTDLRKKSSENIKVRTSWQIYRAI